MNRTPMLNALLISLTLAASPATAAPGPAAPAADEAQKPDELLERARDLIEDGRFDRALDPLDRIIKARGARTDAALYWKAYSLDKLNQRAEALTTIADLEKQFGSSRW